VLLGAVDDADAFHGRFSIKKATRTDGVIFFVLPVDTSALMHYCSFMDNVKTCPVCGEQFLDSVNKGRIYCSSQCRKRGWARQSNGFAINDHSRQCLFCSSVIPKSTRIDKMFCNATCTNNYKSQQLTKEAIEKYSFKQCSQCGGPLPHGGTNKRKYCSSKCAEKYRYSLLSEDEKQQDNERRQKLHADRREYFNNKNKEYYLANKEKAHEYSKAYKKNNPEKFKEWMKKTKQKFKETLPDHYVIELIRKHARTIDPSQITDQAIRLKRVQVQITRTLKEQQNEASNIKRRKR